jgi:hypothetical protein
MLHDQALNWCMQRAKTNKEKIKHTGANSIQYPKRHVRHSYCNIGAHMKIHEIHASIIRKHGNAKENIMALHVMTLVRMRNTNKSESTMSPKIGFKK